MKTLKLPENLMIQTVNLPPSGTGHRFVKIILKNGMVLHNHRIINSEILVLGDNDDIDADDIERLEIENEVTVEFN